MKTPEEAARFRVEKALEHSPASRPDMAGWVRFARAAEQAGIESVLISFSRHEPDPMFVTCALGRSVEKLKFIVAYRSGLLNPTTFVQQFNTLSTLVNGRVRPNLVAGSSRPSSKLTATFSTMMTGMLARRNFSRFVVLFGGIAPPNLISREITIA